MISHMYWHWTDHFFCQWLNMDGKERGDAGKGEGIREGWKWYGMDFATLYMGMAYFTLW